MKIGKIFRLGFQVAALAIFIYQMTKAFIKFRDQPIVVQQSQASSNIIPKPNIFICQEEQYRYTEAKMLGYR